jgi:methylenetetrahydrofolate dehydrogenase (NADP+)/methenyltetrahydrofolate cyclohydrolase
MKIFNGKGEAEKILLDLKKKIKKKKVNPKLAVISVGSDPASKLFIRNKKRAAKRVGIKVLYYKFKKNVKKKEIIREIRELNKDTSVNGIIVQLPLPKKFRAEDITREISLRKDVDGFKKKTFFPSPLISAILIALRQSRRNLGNKDIVALVNSDIFGQTLKRKLARKRIKIKYILRKKLTGKKLKEKLQKAGVVITVCGCPKLIKKGMIKRGAVLIDAGITVLRGKVVGDVEGGGILEKASFLTPVPRGLGPLTVALLLKNVYSAQKYGKCK